MNIAILGAGVAGASAAIALTLRGHAVHVYERRPAAVTLGAGVTLWPNATFVLAELGVHVSGGRPHAMRRFDATGAPLGAIDVCAIDARMGYPTITVLRRDLQRDLLDRARELGVAVTYGWAAHEVGDGWARSERGDEVRADMIVGAEGRMASASRRYVDPAATPVYQGFVNWVGIAECEVDPHAILDFWGTGLRFGIVPIDAHRAYWAGAQALPRAAIRDLGAQFAGWPQVVQQIIAATPSVRAIAVHDLDPLACWHRGRVVLIGDAAHASLPTSGQGACQALEDAWHLARADSFAGFTAARLAKTRAVTLAGRSIAASLFREDPVARDERARRTDYAQLADAMATGWSAGLPLR